MSGTRIERWSIYCMIESASDYFPSNADFQQYMSHRIYTRIIFTSRCGESLKVAIWKGSIHWVISKGNLSMRLFTYLIWKFRTSMYVGLKNTLVILGFVDTWFLRTALILSTLLTLFYVSIALLTFSLFLSPLSLLLHTSLIRDSMLSLCF